MHELARVGVINNGADGHFENDVYAFASSFIRSFAMSPALCLVFRIETEMHQRVVALAGFHDDVAAFAAITARGAPARNELLPAKGQAAVAAVASFDSDYGLVDEHSSRQKRRESCVVGL